MRLALCVCARARVDVVPCDFAMDWMRDSDSFQEALQTEQSDTYMSSLTHSMAMVPNHPHSHSHLLFWFVFAVVWLASQLPSLVVSPARSEPDPEPEPEPECEAEP